MAIWTSCVRINPNVSASALGRKKPRSAKWMIARIWREILQETHECLLSKTSPKCCPMSCDSNEHDQYILRSPSFSESWLGMVKPSKTWPFFHFFPAQMIQMRIRASVDSLDPDEFQKRQLQLRDLRNLSCRSGTSNRGGQKMAALRYAETDWWVNESTWIFLDLSRWKSYRWMKFIFSWNTIWLPVLSNPYYATGNRFFGWGSNPWPQ